MSTRLARALVLALIATTLAGAARADDKADIRALYGRMSAALKSKDVNALMACGTADFKMKEGGQVMDAKQDEQIVRAQFATFKSVEKAYMTPDKITVKGNKAIVLSSNRMKAIAFDRKDKTKTHVIAGSGTSRDTLVKGPNGWKCSMIETLSYTMTLDGKPMQMDAPGGAKKK